MMDPKTYEEAKQDALESGRYLAVKQLASECSEVIEKALDTPLTLDSEGKMIEFKMSLTLQELTQWSKALTMMGRLSK